MWAVDPYDAEGKRTYYLAQLNATPQNFKLAASFRNHTIEKRRNNIWYIKIVKIIKLLDVSDENVTIYNAIHAISISSKVKDYYIFNFNLEWQLLLLILHNMIIKL